MPTNAELATSARRHLYGNYRPAPIVFARGRGAELFDVEGRRFLDLAAGVAVCSVGHGHPALARVIGEQAATLMHVSNYFYNEPNILLAAELARRTRLERAMFCNSGAEANEAALKLARRHFYAQGQKSRLRIVAFENAFHGRTLGALSMTGTPKYREGFGELPGVTHARYGDVEAVRQSMGSDVAAIIVEPLQGEGGVLPAPPGFVAALRRICDDAGALLIVDEIQTGIGRLGHFLAIDGAGVKADVVTLAKGLGGGFPIGVMLCAERYANALPPGTHGTTFGGNALASAAALAVLKIIDDEKLIEGVRAKGEHLARLLGEVATALPEVCEGARGQGLLQGVLLREGFVARDILPKLQDRGILLTAAGERVLRFSPPLIVTQQQLEEGVAAVRAVLEELASLAQNAVLVAGKSSTVDHASSPAT